MKLLFFFCNLVLKYFYYNNFLYQQDETYSIKNDNEIPKIYGISQNPDTKDYIMVLNNNSCCKECDEIYTKIYYKWCKPCQ